MLTLQEYKTKFPGALHWSSWAGVNESGERFVTEGMLLFTEKSAHLWGGPFKGNYAQFSVFDHTHDTEILGESESDEDQPSRERPIWLHIFGNDDTSYSKFYATEQEALDELVWLSANEPLDFHEVMDLGFVFTN